MEWNSDALGGKKKMTPALEAALSASGGDVMARFGSLSPALWESLVIDLAEGNISTSDKIKLLGMMDDRLAGKVAEKMKITIDTRVEVRGAVQILEAAGVVVDVGFLEALENGSS